LFSLATPLATVDDRAGADHTWFEMTQTIREMFGNRLAKNARHRRKWARRRDITCYRLYDRDIPEVPLALDWYEGSIDPSGRGRKPRRVETTIVLSHFAARDGEDEAWLAPLVDEIRERLEPDAVYVKTRERQRGSDQYERLSVDSVRAEVSEGGHRFLVNFTDYLDVGLFLDHRDTRAMVAAEAGGRRVLNLFAYTGSFSVYAAGAGAAATVSVDMSRTYTDWAAENFALNDIGGDAHRIICADVFDWLETGSGVFDIAVLDPPIFSNSKKMSRSFDVQRDHVELIARLSPRILPGGRIYFSTPRRKLSLHAGAVEALGYAVEDITAPTTPEDFKRRPHRAFRLTRR
jgi:23S rRNA G2069 N7-methylase RlmK/C1962 C5-methylase RlmI